MSGVCPPPPNSGFAFVFLRKKFLPFFLVFLSNTSYCWHQYQGLTKDVSSVVGAPWRCGVLTTSGGIAGIGLGRLLGGEHASTPQSGVEAPRLLKRSLPRWYYLLLLLFWTRLSKHVSVHTPLPRHATTVSKTNWCQVTWEERNLPATSAPLLKQKHAL